MKSYYQLVFKDPETRDREVSREIFPDIINAWLYAMSDCENDRDIAYLLEKVSTGEISMKTLEVKE